MDALPKSRLLRFVERAMVLARRAVKRFPTRYSLNRFTLRQHVVLLCLKVKKTATYRDLVDELIEMPRIRDALDLDSIPGKEGSAPLRWALVQCVHVSVRYDDYLGNFCTRLKQRKNKQIAIVATARKMLVSIFDMLKRQEPYDPPEVSA